jgi:hypothetical protein
MDFEFDFDFETKNNYSDLECDVRTRFANDKRHDIFVIRHFLYRSNDKVIFWSGYHWSDDSGKGVTDHKQYKKKRALDYPRSHRILSQKSTWNREKNFNSNLLQLIVGNMSMMRIHSTLSCPNSCNIYKYHCQIPLPVLLDVRYKPKEQGWQHEGYECKGPSL